VQALPVWWATRNPLLAYNVIYLVTMTLTGVAAHGLAVRLSGRQIAGVVAGVLCMLNDYRTFWSLSHLHTLSIHWWIFGLWALDVFIATRSRALTAATAALIALQLSSNYLMAYCAPFTAAFAVWSLARHGRLRDRHAWAGVVGAGVVSVAAVLPVVWKYLATRQALGFERTLEETSATSATFAAYAAARPGMAPLVLLGLAGVAAPAAAVRLSRRARAGLFVLALAAGVLALGPVIRLDGETYTGPYLILRLLVPGFEGLRAASLRRHRRHGARGARRARRGLAGALAAGARAGRRGRGARDAHGRAAALSHRRRAAVRHTCGGAGLPAPGRGAAADLSVRGHDPARGGGGGAAIRRSRLRDPLHVLHRRAPAAPAHWLQRCCRRVTRRAGRARRAAGGARRVMGCAHPPRTCLCM
jgi:hypothetical protein